MPNWSATRPAAGGRAVRGRARRGHERPGRVATLAARHGRDLSGEDVFVVPMGGATNIGHFLEVFGPRGFGVRLAGLCDEGEEPASAAAWNGPALPGPGRSAGTTRFLRLRHRPGRRADPRARCRGDRAADQAQGELGPFRTFAKQPAQRARPREQQLRRFMGTRSGRKIHYGQVLAEALDLTRVPRRWPASSPTSDPPILARVDRPRRHARPHADM